MPKLSEVKVAARNLRRRAARRRARVARADNHAKRIGARCPRCKKGTILRIVQAQAGDLLLPALPKMKSVPKFSRSPALVTLAAIAAGACRRPPPTAADATAASYRESADRIVTSSLNSDGAWLKVSYLT
ncbi:MAG TPA: hypothetical protein VKO16_00205, partial [Polyangia bacterium]|nr:hypothetical protein [Polyangia bacterium]